MADKKIDYSFIGQPNDALKCSICLEIARGQPMQHGGGCGRLFCKECISKYGSNPCPICRGSPQYFPDSKSLRDIKSLGVRCDNVDRGCEWTGTVGTLEDHVAECGYTLVECTNKCRDKGESLNLMKKDLNNHIKSECPHRAYKCKFCHENGTYISIMGDHDLQCSKKPIPCPNTDCTLTVEREGVEEHLASECEHTIVACKYSNIGCPERMKRKDIKKHEEDDKIHLRLSLNKVSQLDNIVLQLNNTVAQLKVVVKGLTSKVNGEANVYVNVPNFAKIKESNGLFYSKPFFTIPNGYKMQLGVYCTGYGDAKGTIVSAFINLLDVPYKDHLMWPFKGTVTYKLLNQLEDKNHFTIRREYSEIFDGRPGGSGWGITFRLSLLAHNTAANTQYLVNDTLHFRLTIQEEVPVVNLVS